MGYVAGEDRAGGERAEDRGDADAPLARGLRDELLHPPCPLDVAPLLAAARDVDVLPGVPLS